MSTTTLFKKHFPEVYGGAGVGLMHPNMEAFFEELNEECLKDDVNGKNKKIVCSRYPDAYERKYASLSMVIWCPMLNCRLSGFFHTFEEAWLDAVKWIEKKEAKAKN